MGSAGTDRVTTTVHVAADGLETSRVSNIASSPQVPDLTRSIDPVNDRDYAKRVTKATLQTGTARYIYAQYAYDSAGRIIRQWGPSLGDGSGYLEAARTGQTPTYTYDATSGLKTQDNLQLQTVGSGLNTVGPISSTYSYTSRPPARRLSPTTATACQR